MYIYISFYKDLTDKVRRKAIHIVDNPKTLFLMMTEGVSKTEWIFFSFMVDCSIEHLSELYKDYYSTEKPPLIIDGFMFGERYKYHVVEVVQ
jgi:hypothetical protein